MDDKTTKNSTTLKYTKENRYFKLGLIARCDSTGLATQTEAYAKHLQPDKVLVIDLDELNATNGKITKSYPEKYKDFTHRVTRGIPSKEDCEWLLTGIDILLVVETPLNHAIYEMARAKGVKSVCHVNPEFFDPLMYPYPRPDNLWFPTAWLADELHNLAHEWGIGCDYVPVPVDRELFPFKQRFQAKKFLHIAGHPTTDDRNGTQIVLNAIQYIKSDVEVIIRSPRDIAVPLYILDGKRPAKLTVISEDVKNYQDLYHDEDVLLLPRKYGGLSLQLNEAMSLGMLPIMSNVSPQNQILDWQHLVWAELSKIMQARTKIGVYEVDPQALARRIDMFANTPEEDIRMWSDGINSLAGLISWDKMLPTYYEALVRCL